MHCGIGNVRGRHLRPPRRLYFPVNNRRKTGGRPQPAAAGLPV